MRRRLLVLAVVAVLSAGGLQALAYFTSAGHGLAAFGVGDIAASGCNPFDGGFLASTLAPGSSATAVYDSGICKATLGIPRGDVGATGATGAAGADGLPGATGGVGPAGSSGAPGTDCSGAVPISPARTCPGATGATGAQGPQGNTGATGAQGPAGTNGTNGTNGVSGYERTSAAAGLLGAPSNICDGTRTVSAGLANGCGVSVTCPGGKKVLGGGVLVTSGTGSLVVTSSWPGTSAGSGSSDFSWYGEARNISASANATNVLVRVYAVCATA